MSNSSVEVMSGKVKFFNEQKGFGFILPDNEGKDIFFHNTKVLKDSRPLRKDDKVTYILADGKKGSEAIEIGRV